MTSGPQRVSTLLIIASMSLAVHSGNASAQDNDLAVPRNAMEIGGFSYSEGRVLRSTDGERVVDLFAYPDRRSPRPDGRVNQIFSHAAISLPAAQKIGTCSGLMGEPAQDSMAC